MRHAAAREFEQACLDGLKWYERQGECHASRYGVKAVRRKLEDQSIQLMTVQSLPDIEGVIAPHGRQFVFDCKVCTEAAFYFRSSKSFSQSQLPHLLARSGCGALCFVAIHFFERELKTKTQPAMTFAFPVSRFHPYWDQMEGAKPTKIDRAAAVEYGYPIPWTTPGRTTQPRPDVMHAIREMLK